MAAGIGNPLGYVPAFDGQDPAIIGGIARTNISGGVWCYASGAADAVSSGLNSYITTDIGWVGDASGDRVNGVMIQYTGSNTYGAVATKGVIIALCDGTVTAGYPVWVRGANGVADALAGSTPHGRALTGAGSEGYALIQLGL